MPKPENQSCKNCLFMVLEISPYGGDPDPHCHRMPPAFYSETVQSERPGTLDKTTVNKAWCGWPETKNDNWCGEWTPTKQCTCDKRDSSFVCNYCYQQGLRGRMQT